MGCSAHRSASCITMLIEKNNYENLILQIFLNAQVLKFLKYFNLN